MAARRARTAPAGSYARAIAGLGVLAGAAATYFGLPGAVAVWGALLAAGWLEQAPAFTGRKDARGFPTPAHPGEQAAMNSYRFWADLRWRLVCPTSDWLPGWPVLGSWIVAVLAAALASFAPVRPGLPPALGWANIAAAFIVAAQAAASRRRTVAEGDQCPGTRVDALRLVLADRKAAVSLAVAAVACAAVAGYAAATLIPQVVGVSGPIGQISPLMWPGLVAVTAAVGVAARPLQGVALATWREVVMVRREWAPRWQALKQDPAPRLVAHTVVGPATVDTFEAPPSAGAQSFFTQAAKITPTLGANLKVAVLELPNTDGQGQPVPGTVHPLRFDVVMWPVDQLPDISTPGTPGPVAELLARSAMAWAADMIGFARFVLTGCDLVTEPESPAVWATQWAPTMEIGLAWVRNQANGALAAGARVPVLTDHRALGGAGVIYFGAVFDDVSYAEESGLTAQAVAEVAEEDEWRARWAATLKQNVNAPVPQFAVKAEGALSDGTIVHYQPFVTLSGEDPAAFMTGLEGKLAATIPGSAPFMAISWYSQRSAGRLGERHAQAFAVAYANRPVPPVAGLAPCPGEAPRWVITGHMNGAFVAARLARPEVLQVQCLTAPASREHIWQVSLRLYGGVTLTDVRAAAPRIRTALGCRWLRVAPATDGCLIYAGGDPAKVKLAKPERDASRLVALDWEQAWLDSKVSGVDALVPVLTGVGHLPRNEAVQVLDFDLPSGLSVADIKAATEKLKTATGNAFVDVRPGAGGASTLRLLVCDRNPLPETAAFDFDEVDASAGIPFATGIDGEPITYNPRVDPHLLVAGASNGGKSVTLQDIIYGGLVRGWEVYIADPTKGAADFRFAEPYARAVTVDAFEAAAMMKAIYAEVVRRKDLNSRHGVGNYRDLPDDVRPRHMLVVIDEFTSLMGADPVPRPSEDPAMDHERDLVLAVNQAKMEIGVYSGKCAREARSAGLTLVLATQKLSAKLLDTIPGAGDLKVNLSRMLLGKATLGDRQSALRAPFDAPDLGDAVPPGRGLWETTEGAAKVMQSWFDPRGQALLAEQLAARVQPLVASERLDLAPFMAGAARPAAAPAAAAAKVVDLGQMEVSLEELLQVGGAEPAGLEERPPWELDLPAAGAADLADGREVGLGGGDDWLADAVVFLSPEALSCGAPGPWADAVPLDAGDRGELVCSPSLLGRLGRAPAHVVWVSSWGADAQEVLGAALGRACDVAPMRASARYGWWKLDAVAAWLDAHRGVRTIVWVDPELAEVDDLDVEHWETVTEVLAARGMDPVLVGPAGGVLSLVELEEVEAVLAPCPLGHALSTFGDTPEADSPPEAPSAEPWDTAEDHLSPVPDAVAPPAPAQRRSRLLDSVPDEF